MKYYTRFIEKNLGSSHSRSKIKLLLGARQTGKSSLLTHLYGKDCLLIKLQDIARRQEFEKRPQVLKEILLGSRHRRIVIDEIQKVPLLLDVLQEIHDENPHHFDIFVTGSSARKLKSDSANLLPGRSHLYSLFPTIQWERNEALLSPLFPHQEKNHTPFPSVKLNDLLLYGSLPGSTQESLESWIKTLEAYTVLYIEEEIRREGLVKNVGAFAQFLELAALESGKIINLTKLSQESGIHFTTIRSFYQILVDTFVGYFLEPFTHSSRRRLLTSPRFYFFDMGVRNSTARLPLEEALLKIDFGSLFEHWVGLELIHRAKTLGRGYKVSFWRTASGAEVDFVLETPKEIIPIEVKATEKPALSDARHLQTFLDDYASKAKKGYIICRVPERRKLSDQIEALPWDEF